nr:hypothetical protein [Anaerolineae bacterium]
KVQLLRSARVWGDITATTITTEEGAFIEGKINMLGSKPVSPFETETPVADTPPTLEEPATTPTDEATS